ncbi:nicotinamidase [Parasteatoda tepidariorum]|uniref:nicotinamidase n=1 Tax=Parasteatoda tepidariorum TaxID=114398 RepID=UPI001C721986|nr:nicotinamidase-like [Parasteatoda tepidariorum]
MFSFDSSINFDNPDAERKCFLEFDSNNKGYLDENDFFNLLQALVCKETKPTIADSAELFCSFDKNKDGKIDSVEYMNVWHNWIKKLVSPITALLVIDVQNDFIDGSLALRCCPAKQDAKEVIPVINNILQTQKFDVIVYSLDYHPENHISFIDNVNLYELSGNYEKDSAKIKLFDRVKFSKPIAMEQVLWPKHCIQKTWGSEFHPDLKVIKDSIMIYKGTNSDIDSYSAFYDNLKLSETSLHSELQKRHVTHVFVCGIAYDYCVSFTAIDALELGYATVVIRDATKGTDETSINVMTEKLKNSNCVIENSSDLEKFLTAKSINLEFAKVMGKHIN